MAPLVTLIPGCNALGVPPASPWLPTTGARRAAGGVRGSAGEKAEPAAGAMNALVPFEGRIGAQPSLDFGRGKPDAP